MNMCLSPDFYIFYIQFTAQHTWVWLALVHISMMQWNLHCSWALPHKGVGRWFFSRFPAKIVSLTSLYSHWRHQLASSFVTQSIHTSLSLLKPAENPLSFALTMRMSGNYFSREWIWRVILHSFYMFYFILYSLSWIYFRKSFGWFCLRRIFITLPGKTDTRRRTLDVRYKRLKIWLLFVFVIHSTKTSLHSISKYKTRKFLQRVYMSKFNMFVILKDYLKCCISF